MKITFCFVDVVFTGVTGSEKKETRTYKADSLEDFKKKYPEAKELLMAFTVPENVSLQTAQDEVIQDYTEEQATRGKGLYSQECASCHGSELTGGEMAPPLAGCTFAVGIL